MQAYAEVCEPTAVNATISLNFVSADEQNLIVAKTSLLQIFRFAQFDEILDDADNKESRQDAVDADRRVLEGADHEEAFGGADVVLQRTNIETTTKFVLVAEYTLSGSITSLAGIKTLSSKSGGDCLLVAFESAKLSLLEWDPSTFNISTISLHYYEREEFKSPIMPDNPASFLISDPASRCAALKFNRDMLAILPFRQKEDEDLVLGDDDDGEEVDGEKDTVMTDEPEAIDNETSTTATLKKDTPYYPSFVVAASQLDEAIENIIDITFLHEYREPTLAVLYESKRSCTGLLEVRKDTISFIIITLDLDQRASTPILSVAKLPYDIYKAVSLPPPIGGTLLVGCNEIIHVDQAAKTTAVAVNQFARQSSAYPMIDQSVLELKLENAVVEPLPGEDGDLLMVTDHGVLIVVSFKMEGRNVSGLTLTKCQKKDGSQFLYSASTGMASLGNRRMFIGSMSNDSVIMGWRHRGERVGPSAKTEVIFAEEEAVDYENDDLDDLYGDSSQTGGDNSKKQVNASGRSSGKSTGEYIFRILDRLANVGPCRDVTFGKPLMVPEKHKTTFDISTELDIVTTTGESREGGISVLRRKIVPEVIGRFEYKDCLGLWTVRARKRENKGPMASITGVEEEINVGEQYDRYLFASKADESLVFNVGAQFDEIKGTEFDSSGATITVGAVMDGQRIVQVCETDMRVYDSDLQLSQIIPMFDEETGQEPTILAATISGPYVLVHRDDGSIVVYTCDKQTLEVEEIPRPDSIKTTKYIASTLINARNGELSINGNQQLYHCFLLDHQGSLQMFNLPGLDTPAFVCDNFSTLPPHLNRDAPFSRQNLKENISEILLAYLGDESSSYPYLIVRTSQDDIVLYQPYIDTSQTPNTIHFKKIPNYTLASPIGERDKSLSRAMIVLENVSGYSCVFMPGTNPCFIMKSSKGYPRQYPLSGSSIRSLSSFHAQHTERGFLYVDSAGIVRVCHMPSFSFEHSWLAKKVVLEETSIAVAYHAPLQVYLVCTVTKQEMEVGPEDDVPNSWHAIQAEGGFDGVLMPEVDVGSLKLVSPLTWTVVDSYDFGPNEVGLIVKSVELEVSEESKARKQLIAVGTGVMRGEEMSARGGIYVFEVIEVVPEPGRPETNRKLKLIVHEDVKGTISALCGVEGYLLAAQGQKVMVRGLKEDQSLLPVAFLDMNMYVSVAKNLNGMILFGDIMKSIWFVGFSEEPYKMMIFGKDVQKLEVMSADFLPDAEHLFFVVADADSNLHIMQFDPEHPKSLTGQRLIRRADMFTGHEIRSVTMLPRCKPPRLPAPSEDGEADEDEFLCLTTALTGAMAIVVNLPEVTYRRLNILQGQLTNSEEQFAGLNPRAYRACRYKSASTESLRGVLDAGFIKRWLNSSKGRRADLANRAGSTDETIRKDLWELQHALGF